MRKLYFYLLAVALCSGCAKTQFEYAVICKFPTVYDPSWLVVTNDEGDILQSFDLAPGQTQISEEFSIQARTAANSYNLHLLKADTTSSGSFVEVHSQYGVKNAAAVVFEPEYVYYNSTDDNISGLHIYINDVFTLDSLDIPGIEVNTDISSSSYDPVLKLLEIGSVRLLRQDVLVRIRSQPSAPFYSLYIPAAGITTDSMTFNGNDLAPEIDLRTIDLPSNEYVSGFTIDALDANYQRYVTLAQGKDGALPAFNFPAGVYTNSLLRVRLRQGAYICDKIFLPGEPLKIEPADMQITHADISSEGILAVNTKGNIDLLSLNFALLSPGTADIAGHWFVKGDPATLRQATLPDLSSIIAGVSPKQANEDILVYAYRYDGLNYNQLQEGLPYKGSAGKLFPHARYGLKVISNAF